VQAKKKVKKVVVNSNWRVNDQVMSDKEGNYFVGLGGGVEG